MMYDDEMMYDDVLIAGALAQWNIHLHLEIETNDQSDDLYTVAGGLLNVNQDTYGDEVRIGLIANPPAQ